MNKQQFWQKATDHINYYRSRFHHALLTEEEHNLDVDNFLSDMTELSSEWRNRQSLISKGEKVK